jgi:type IV secretory pathway VirB10-like protein
MTRTPAFGTPATRLHAGRILLVVILLVGIAIATWVWLFHKGAGKQATVTESSTTPGWTAAQMHYEKPEVKAEAPAPKPVDMTAAELAKLRAMLAQMQAEIEALKNRKTPVATTVVQKETPKEPVKKVPGSLLFVAHDVKEAPPKPRVPEYTLGPATFVPCILETSIISEVQGNFVCVVSTNIFDTATGRHLLVSQGSKILGADTSLDLLYGNERLPTFGLTLRFPDGRSVDLGHAPVMDQKGSMGLTGKVDSHFWRLAGAVLIGGALRGGVQAMQTAMAQAAGAGPFVSGYGSVLNQALSPRLGRALDTRPTITIDAGLANLLLLKPLSLPAMWQ